MSLLTPKQKQVMLEVCEGHSAKQIAHTLSIHPQTVGKHFEHIKERLGARNLPHAVSLLYQKGGLDE